MSEAYTPTEGDLRREADEEKYRQAKVEFFREWISGNFDEFIKTSAVDEYLHRRLHVELHELYYDTIDPDPLDV